MAIRLLAITDPGCEVSTRYRVTQYEPYLHQHQVHLQTLPWPQSPTEQARLLELVAAADVTLIQRFLPQREWLRQIRRHAKRLVYDFDDAVIYAESTRGNPRLLLDRWWRFRAMMRWCDVVTAGNSYLVELAQRKAGPNRVHLIPTTVELDRYDREPSPTTAGSVLGWIGGRWTLPYLELLRQPLEQLSAEIAGLTVHVIADQALDLGKTRVELIPWATDTEVRDLKRLCAGLAPLPDDAWTRGKCALRLLQYLAAGTPAVASPVGTQADIIRAGAVLPAATGTDWLLALRHILTDHALATSLVARGQQLVHDEFSTSSWADRVRDCWCGDGWFDGRFRLGPDRGTYAKYRSSHTPNRLLSGLAAPTFPGKSPFEGNRELVPRYGRCSAPSHPTTKRHKTIAMDRDSMGSLYSPFRAWK